MESQFGSRALPFDQIESEGTGVWRCGELLVAEHGASLPRRCVRCNRPVDGTPVYCHLLESPTKWWLLTLVGVLPWYAVRAVRGRRSALHVHFCPIHLGRQRAAIRIAILFWTTGAMMIGLAWMRHGLDSLAGVLAILIGVIAWLLSPGTLAAARIDRDHVWVEGVDGAFLAELPARAGDYSLN
jgi:hypothetical protein